jgi:hypothetical protein
MATEQEKKLESQLNDLTAERLKLDKEIADIKSRVGDQLKTSISDTEKLLKLEALRLDNVEKQEEILKQIEKIEIDSKKRLDETVVIQKDSTSQVRDQVDLSKELYSKQQGINRSVKNLVDDQSQSSALIKAINGDSSKTLDYVQNQNIAYTAIAKSLDSVNTITSGTVDQQMHFADIQTKNASLADELLNTEDKLQHAKEKGNGSSFQAIDISRVALDLKVREADLEQNKSNMTAEQYTASRKTLDLMKGRLKDIENENDSLQRQADIINAVSDAVGAIGLNAGAIINKFPGGDKINKIMGIDKTTAEIKKKFAEAIKSGLDGNFKDAFKQGLGGLKSMVALAPKFLAALGIGLLLSAINFLVGAIGKADEEAAEIGQEFGIARSEAFALRDASIDIAGQMKLVGINSKEVVKGIKTTSEIMGGIDIAGQIASGNKQAQQLVKDVTVLSEKFGMSSDEIKNIQSISAMTGKSMGQLTKEATTLGKGIMTSKESLKALAKIPPSVTVAFKGGTQELIKAAQKAQALGHDLKKVQDIGDGLMDIESSLTKEMEARVLSGKNINLDLARQYALEGDIAGLQDELLNQAGSLEDFTKMNRLAQKSMAEAMGMSVEEMTEMLTNAEKLKTLGISQERMTSLQAMNAAELNKELAKGGSAQLKDYIQQLAKEKESAEIKKRMADILQKVQEKLSKLLTPILEMVHGMLDAAEAGGDFDAIVASISGIIKGIIPIVKVLFTVIGSLLKPISAVLGMFFSVEDTTQGVTDGVGKVTDGVDKVTGAVKGTEAGFGDILKAVTLIGGAFAAKGLISAGLGMMKDKVLDVGKNIMGSIGGSLSKVGGKMGGIAGKAFSKIGGGKAESIASPVGDTGGGGVADTKGAEKGKNIVSGILDKVKSIIDSIKGVIKSAIDLFREVGKDLLATLNDLIKGIGEILKTGVQIIVDVGTKLAEGAMKILNIIMKGLADAAKTLPSIMGSLGQAVVAFFTPMQALMNPAIIVGIIVFTAAMIGLGYAFKLLGEGIGAAAPGIKAFFEGVGGIIQKVGEAIAKVIETITTSVIRLQNIDGAKMASAALGIYAIAGALAAFGGGSAIAGLGSALGKLFDEDPVDKFNRFAGINAPGLLAVATAVNTLGSAIKNFNFGGIDGKKLEEFGDGLEHLVGSISGNALAEGFSKLTGGEGPIVKIQQLMTSLDPAKMSSVSKSLLEVSNSLKILADTINNINVDKLSQVMEKVSGGGIGSKISGAVDSLVGGITSIFGGGEDNKGVAKTQSATAMTVSPTTATSIGTSQTASPIGQGSQNQSPMLSMANVEKKLDTLISVIADAANKPTVIKIGEKTVEEIKSQLDFRKSYNVAVDNSYGRMVQK